MGIPVLLKISHHPFCHTLGIYSFEGYDIWVFTTKAYAVPMALCKGSTRSNANLKERSRYNWQGAFMVANFPIPKKRDKPHPLTHE
jgi:hypothetical protein